MPALNLVGLSLISCGTADLVLAAYVLLRRRRRRAEHIALGAVLLGLALWTFAMFGVNGATRVEVVTAMGRLAYALGAAAGTGFLVFTWLFPETSHPRPSRATVLAVLLLGGAVSGISLTSLVQASVDMGPPAKRPVLGPLHPLLAAYMLTVFVWSICNLCRSRLRTTSGRERMQLNYVLCGFGLGFITVSTTNFALPLLSVRNDVLLAGAALSTLCFVTVTSYAVLRHRLMDIGVAFRNVLIKAGLAAVLAPLVLLPFSINERAYGQTSVFTQVLTVVLVIVVLAIYLPDIQRGIASFVDQRLFRGRYDHETALVRFGNRLSRSHGWEGIAAAVASEIPIILRAEWAAVYLPTDDGKSYALATPRVADVPTLPEVLPGDDPLVASVLSRRRHMLRDEIPSGSPGTARATAFADSLGRLSAAGVWPLVCQDRALGLLLLGEKRRDNAFTSDDIELLGALASQAAFALDNARLYEQAVGMRRHYETMLRHMQRGVLTVDASLCIVTLNDTGAAILGVRGDACIGKPVAVIVPEFSEQVTTTLEKRADQPAVEVSLATVRGATPCECETSLMLDARGRITGAMLVFQDLTEKKRFQETVRRMDRLASVGTLAAGLAHEIKNPLVSIQTFTQLLPERYQDRAFRDGFGAVVRDEVNRINRLVQGLLEFARPRPCQIGPVAVHELLDRSVTLLGGELRRHDITVLREYGEGVPVLSADGERLFQVFFNLLQNAVQAMGGPGGRIVLTTSPCAWGTGPAARPAVSVSVHDTGQGIDPAHLPHIFDPFFSTKANGTGLGLAICHTILQEHGAHVDVSSVLGKGTTFTVTLPLAPPGATAATAPDKET
jgi:PAS domain S-box-containing protein